MGLKAFASEVTRVLVRMHHKFLVQSVRTPTTLVLCLAFPVRRVDFPRTKGVWNARNVRRGICNRNQNNRLATKQRLEKWLLKEVLRLLSFQKGRRSMHPTPVVSKHVPPEPRAMIHPMNRVKIALLEHPAHPVPQHAKPATKESSTTKPVVLAAIVYM